MDLLEVGLISVYAVCLWGYHYLYFFLTERKDMVTQRNRINEAIHSWFDTSIEEKDYLLVIHQLRNVIMAVTFLATAVVLLLGLLFGLSPSALPEPLENGNYALWVVPDETTEEAMIRGRVTDDNDLSHQNETDLFTIMGRPPAPPENLDVEHYGTDEENGTEDNLVTWDASPDDLEKVSQYNVYRAEEEDGDYEFVGSVDAEGAADYEYVDEDKGTADDTLWWYIVHSEDDYEQVCEGAGPAREPEPLAPTEPQPEDGWLSIWWPFLILVSAAFVAMAGGILYKKRSSTEEPVIEEIFLISKRNSMLILHNTRRLKPDRDSDIIAGMFESVQKFIEDSFQDAEDWTLNKMEFGDNKVLVERGEHVYMAVVYKGEFSEEKVQEIRDVIAKIEEEFGEQLEEWDGDRKEIQGIDNIIEELFS